jgi:hypothetical protein
MFVDVTYVVSAFRRTVTVRLKPDTTYEKTDPYFGSGTVGTV